MADGRGDHGVELAVCDWSVMQIVGPLFVGH